MDNSQSKPFYLSNFWFSNLYSYVFSSSKLFDLKYSTYCLPHIIDSYKFHTLNLKRLKSLTNFYTPEFIANLPPTCGDVNFINFYSQISSICTVDIIEVSPVSNENSDDLIKVLEDNNYHCEKYYLTTNWTHPDITTIEDFWMLRPSQIKNTLRRKKAKLNKNFQYSISISNPDSDIHKLLEDYHKVYNKSWKVSEPYPNFINDICLYEHNQNNLRLGVLYIDNMPVAAQIWFIHQKTAYIFKLSYDEQFESLGVGSVLMEAMFNHVITEDSINLVDFLTGNDAYKRDWMTKCRPLFGVRAFNKRTIKGFICFISLAFKKKLSKLRAANKNHSF